MNCYSRKDLILSLMYQIKKFGLKPGRGFVRMGGCVCGIVFLSIFLTLLNRTVCGTCAVNVAGVDNLDVTDLVSGHQDYTLVAGEILKRARHGEPFRSESADYSAQDNGVEEEERRQMAQLRAMHAQQR